MQRNKSRVVFSMVGVLAMLSMTSACSSTTVTDAGNDDVSTADQSVADTATGDVATDTGLPIDVPVIDTGTDTGPVDSGFAADGSPLGCANGGAPCASGQMCCSGLPYPNQGICSLSCGAVSDRNRKQNFADVDGDATLEALSHLPVTSWNYIGEPSVRHVGPMAQDFRATFGLGTDERTIHPIDENGVTIAALQALYRRVVRLEQSNAELRDENRALRRSVDAHARH